MARYALILALLSACIPASLVERAKDRDGDGYQAWQVGGDDCDDSRADVHPGATEVCGNGIDDDCDGVVDDDGIGALQWYPDRDGDGYGVDEPISACSQPEGYLPSLSAGVDCDDDDPNVNPGADEICSTGVDENCDGEIDDFGVGGEPWYPDRDRDGYPADEPVFACSTPGDNYYADLSAGIDCDDFDRTINPGATEIWYDGIDQDCDGWDDFDQDRDGYRSSLYTTDGDDCDDTNPEVNPGATEICNNGLDDDCSGGAPECHVWGEVDLSTLDLVTTFSTGFVFKPRAWVEYDRSSMTGRLIVHGNWTTSGSDQRVRSYSFSSLHHNSPLDLLGSTPSTPWGLVGDLYGTGVPSVVHSNIVVSFPGGNAQWDAHISVQLGPIEGQLDNVEPHWLLTETRVAGIAVIDLNLDGRDEVVLFAVDGGFWIVDEPSGSATNVEQVASGSATLAQRLGVLAVGDLDNDGSRDVVYSVDFGGSFPSRVVVNTGGVFRNVDSAALRSIRGTNLSTTLGQTGCVGDVDGDGILDVVVSRRVSSDSFIEVVAGPISEGETIVPNDSEMTFGPLPFRFAALQHALGCGDFNGDGHLDLIVPMAGYGLEDPASDPWGLAIYYGPLQGRIDVQPDVVFVGARFASHDFLKDVDGDGRDDLILEGLIDGDIVIVHGRGM